jgi:hyperosmotically inducible periplasmic protein
MKRNAKSIVAVAAALTALFIVGAPVRASETDQKVESSFKETFVYKTYLADDAIKTSAKDGVVTLTGTVAEESHKTLAQETVLGLPGVVRVDNQLATKEEVATEKSDIWIGRKAKLALLFHRNVSVRATTIAVQDGVVTLTGEAASEAQKALTAEYVQDIDGVVEVKNEMTVAATPAPEVRTASEKLDDASVTAQVKTALQSHRSTSAIKADVKTRNGEVTLTGVAKNAAEKALVTKLVRDIRGVTDVRNRMTINEIVTL